MTDTPTKVFIPTEWEATPYDAHWAFAYTTDQPDREDYDFRVEFDPTVGADEQRAVIRLMEAAPALLDELSRIGHQTTITTEHFNRIQRLLGRIEGTEP